MSRGRATKPPPRVSRQVEVVATSPRCWLELRPFQQDTEPYRFDVRTWVENGRYSGPTPMGIRVSRDEAVTLRAMLDRAISRWDELVRTVEAERVANTRAT